MQQTQTKQIKKQVTDQQIEDTRRHERFNATLSLVHSESERKAVLFSYSKGGFAIRTTERLEIGQWCTFNLKLCSKESGERTLTVLGQVKWVRDDFRVDTFYVCGFALKEPLSNADLMALWDAEDFAQSLATGLSFK